MDDERPLEGAYKIGMIGREAFKVLNHWRETRHIFAGHPGIGLMHADLKARDSLVCDLMEAVRPKVDGYVFDFLERHAFKKSDFFESRERVCRLMPTATGPPITTGTLWARELGSVSEFVASRFLSNAPTLLTESRRSAGRARYRERFRNGLLEQ